MPAGFVHVGFNSIVNASRVLAILDPDSAPIKRMIQQAREENKLYDATHGRKTRAVLMLDTGHIMTVALDARTVRKRIIDDIEGERGAE